VPWLGETPEHDTYHCELGEAFGDEGKRFVVGHQTSIASEPGQRPFDHPSPTANAGLPEAAILARNSRLGSQIASCRIGEEIEMRVHDGERYFVVTSLIDLEGAMRLLQPNPDIKLARFHVAEDPAVDVIRGVRAFLSALRAPPVPPEAGVVSPAAERREAPTAKPPAPAERSDPFWPSDWSTVIFADEPEAALGAQFFTRTTPQQEDACDTR
jgi:hypothetical protein